MACHKAATLQKSGGGSSPKLCLSFYKKKTKVWGMDFSEVGAEFGSCGVGLGVIDPFGAHCPYTGFDAKLEKFFFSLGHLG